ncbi:MAG: YhcH/YjgK/YiaL family protein [Planctomycetaceae bacterium]|nr:YhcH/YjgK/YiaL family protein [Planctomycetaceae bacterium]
MIYDVFENIGLYCAENELLHKALSFALDFDRVKPDGRYEIDGDNIYALVMTYNTKSAAELKFETHRKYIDIQLLLEGREFCDVTHKFDLDVETDYSEDRDVALYKANGGFSSIMLEPGNFAILYPNDKHRPSRKIEKFEQVRKMVIKVRTND